MWNQTNIDVFGNDTVPVLRMTTESSSALFLLECPHFSQPTSHFFLRASGRDHAAENGTNLPMQCQYNSTETPTVVHVPECKVRQSEEPKQRRSYHNTCQCLLDPREPQHLRV